MRIVVALGGNALGESLAEQMAAVKSTSRSIVDLIAQATPAGDSAAFTARYTNARVADFDGNPAKITEMDALVAYLQMLGTLVDYTQYDAKSNYR